MAVHPLMPFGITNENPDEVYDDGTDENGNIQYGGWWNICGKIIKKQHW